MTLNQDASREAGPYAVPLSEGSPAAQDQQETSQRREAFTRAHIWVFGVLLGLATIHTFLTTTSGLDSGSGKWRQVVTATVMTISGPLAGAISRDMQSCCLDFSVSLLPWFLPPMIAAFALQQFWRPGSAFGECIRVGFWGLAWLGWFVGGFVSFLHALM